MSLLFIGLIGAFIFGIPQDIAARSETKIVEVSAFHKIKSSSSIDIFLYQGNEERVKLEADDNVIDDIEVKVEDGVLFISLKGRHYWNIKVLNAHISLKNLDGIEISGSGDVYSKTKINTPSLDFRIYGSGDLQLELAADDVVGKINGSGDVDLSGVNNSLDISIMGSGDFDAQQLSLQKCFVQLSGSGDVRLAGTSGYLKIKGNSSGDINALGLKTGEVEVRLSGSGDSQIWAENKIDAKLSGSGDLHYKGSPSENIVEINGSGEVRKY